MNAVEPIIVRQLDVDYARRYLASENFPVGSSDLLLHRGRVGVVVWDQSDGHVAATVAFRILANWIGAKGSTTSINDQGLRDFVVHAEIGVGAMDRVLGGTAACRNDGEMVVHLTEQPRNVGAPFVETRFLASLRAADPLTFDDDRGWALLVATAALDAYL